MPQGVLDRTSVEAAAAAGGSAAPTVDIAVVETSQHLVAVSTRKAALKRKRSQKRLLRQRWRKMILFILMTIIISLVIALSVIIHKRGRKEQKVEKVTVDICRTKECLASAYRVLKAMDKTTDPCDDFYQYACGNWVHEHPLYGEELDMSRFTEARHSLSLEIQDILEAENKLNDPLPVQQARSLYNACMDTNHIEHLGLKPVIEMLQILGLPGQVPSADTVENFNLTLTLALIQYHLTVEDLIVIVGVGPHPYNSSRKLLSLASPEYRKKGKMFEKESIVGPDPGYYAGRKKTKPLPAIQDEIRYRSMVMELFEAENHSGHRLNTSELRIAAMKTLLLEAEIMQAAGNGRNRVIKLSYLQKYVQTGILNSNITDLNTNNTIQWEEFIEVLYKDANNKFKSTNPLMVYDISYFRKVAVILAKAKTETIHPENVYCRYMTSCQQQWDIRLLRIPNSVTLDRGIISFQVEEMLLDIRTAFETLVHQAKWMDEETRKKALIKVHAMGHMIGFPDDLVKQGTIENMYSELIIEDQQFLKSVVNIHTADARRILQDIDTPIKNRSTDIKSDLPDPFIINAYNVIQANFIVIPSGILRVPFYGLGLEAMNYGAIGFVLAHELTHSFDNLGRHFDQNGNMKSWWSKNTSREFETRALCFTKQYGHYEVRDHKVDGRKTLGENIADNGGLRESIRAYHNYKIRKGQEPKLPGLEELSHEQLLFLAFANVWCHSTTRQADLLLLRDVHSPAKYRVIGTLSNMQEFSDAWNCPNDSPMNPENKCILW